MLVRVCNDFIHISLQCFVQFCSSWASSRIPVLVCSLPSLLVHISSRDIWPTQSVSYICCILSAYPTYIPPLPPVPQWTQDFHLPLVQHMYGPGYQYCGSARDQRWWCTVEESFQGYFCWWWLHFGVYIRHAHCRCHPVHGACLVRGDQ